MRRDEDGITGKDLFGGRNGGRSRSLISPSSRSDELDPSASSSLLSVLGEALEILFLLSVRGYKESGWLIFVDELVDANTEVEGPGGNGRSDILLNMLTVVQKKVQLLSISPLPVLFCGFACFKNTVMISLLFQF
jgi:hypothetical protein